MVNGKLIDPVVQPETPFLLPLFSDRLEGTDFLGLPQSIRKTGPGQWLPRVGFAWTPTDRIVVRGADPGVVGTAFLFRHVLPGRFGCGSDRGYAGRRVYGRARDPRCLVGIHAAGL